MGRARHNSPRNHLSSQSEAWIGRALGGSNDAPLIGARDNGGLASLVPSRPPQFPRSPAPTKGFDRVLSEGANTRIAIDSLGKPSNRIIRNHVAHFDPRAQ